MPDFGATVTFPARALRETPEALLCVIADREIWIARSQIGPNSQVRQVGDQGQLIVTAWLAERLGLAEADRTEAVTFESNECPRCRWCGGPIPDGAPVQGFCGRACIEIARWAGWNVADTASTQEGGNV
jgi:hypothetical protein